MNVVEPILFQARLNPLALAICVPGSKIEAVNYRTLGYFIRNIARTALKSGIAPGDVVATFVSDPTMHAALTFGLMHMGAVTLSLRSPKPVEGITPQLVLTDVPGRISGDVTVLQIDPSWLEGDASDDSDPGPFRGNDDDICRIVLTSGSTGLSKGVAMSHRIMAHRTSYYTHLRGPRFAHCPRFFCDLGLSTSPGIHYAMSLLSRGATVYFLGDDPADILQAIDLYQIRGMGTSPYGLGEFLKFFESDAAFDLTFDHVICQGAMLSRELSQRARTRMCQNLYSSYGATETSTVAFGPANVIERVAGAVGYVQPGVIIEAVTSSGEVLPPMRDGALRMKSPQMASGYVGDIETSQKIFRDGYFYSGDIGHLTPEGLLVITGREKTAINLGGDTISPEAIESVLLSFPDIREAAVFSTNNELGIAELAALIVSSAPAEEQALQQFCAEKLPPHAVPLRFLATDALPRGGQGKLERHRLQEHAAAIVKAARGQ